MTETREQRAAFNAARDAQEKQRVDELITDLAFHEANRGQRHDRDACARCRLIAFLDGEGETVDEPRLRHQPFPAHVRS